MEEYSAALFPKALNLAMTDISTEETASGLTVTGTFSFPADSEVFAGHFPGEPILPAVVQLTLVRLLADRALDKDLVPAGVSRIKFNRVVKPAEPILVTLKIGKRDSLWTVGFTITRQAETVASGTIDYREVCQ